MKLNHLTQEEYYYLFNRLFFQNLNLLRFQRTLFGTVIVTVGNSVWAIDNSLFERFLKEINCDIANVR